MATYIVLVNFTDQGIRNVKQSPDRYKSLIPVAEKLGVKMKDIHWTMGAYDAVGIADAPNDEAMTTLAGREFQPKGEFSSVPSLPQSL